jgi:hypothetical protein
MASCVPDESILSRHLRDDPAEEYSLGVVNTNRPPAVGEMMEKLFDRQPVEVVDPDLDGDSRNLVVLLQGSDVVATSSLQALESTILLVNSDLYVTGTVGLDDIDLPDVIAALAETPFHLRGYPESNIEKLPLILISRYIEQLSSQYGGTHRASFQRLSRIQGERGTQNVYRTLGASEADTHVYGVPDWVPPREFGVKIHGGYGCDYQQSWFVVHRSDQMAAALLAIEIGPNEWTGEWTFDADRVSAIEQHIERRL